MGSLLSAAGTAAGTVGDFASKYSNILMPAASIGMGAWQGSQNRKAAQESAEANRQASIEAARANQATWQQSAFPSGEAVNAMNQTLRGNLGQARVGAYQNLGNEMASRGFGPGSGIMAKGAGQIEGNYMKSLADALSGITQFANTPQFGMPGAAYQQPATTAPTTGAIGGAVSQAGGLLDTAYGYRLMSEMLAKLGGGQTQPREYERQQ